MLTQFPWTESDYVSAEWARIKRHPVKIFARFRYVISVFLIVVFAAIANAKWHALLVVCLIFAGTVLFGLLMQRWRWHRAFKKTPFSRGDVTVEIDRQSIRFGGRAGEKIHDWGEFWEIYESPRVFLFERSENGFLFLPKRRISATQIAELRRLIAANARPMQKVSSHAA
jgi:hypothetical protein